MKTTLLALALVWGNLAFAHHGMTHLTFSEGALHAHVTWETGPLESQESVLRVEWKDGATHEPVEPTGTFAVSLFMPDMGHGSSPTKITQVVDENGAPVVGAYRVSSVYFIMAGSWRVDVTLNAPEKAAETQSFDVEISGSGHQHH